MERLKYKRKCTYKSCDAIFYYGKRGLKLVIIQDSKTKKIVEILKEEEFDKCYERDYEVYDKVIDDIKKGFYHVYENDVVNVTGEKNNRRIMIYSKNGTILKVFNG